MKLYAEIPGSETHELPPLIVASRVFKTQGPELLKDAIIISDSDEIVSNGIDPDKREKQGLDLAVDIVKQYIRFEAAWSLGDSILEWVRQCEITFEAIQCLRHLLLPDVWPHAGRSSFVELLAEKSLPFPIEPCKGVGLRLMFHQPPPLQYFSGQSLFYVNGPVADTAYRTWSNMALGEEIFLPPDRFYFQVILPDG